jgi:addiction module HigA family antidote
MTAIAGIRMKRPAHPGGFIKHEIIGPVGLSVTRAAEVLGVTRATLSTLLNERAHLSPDMAVRIEKAFGVSMDTLMRMQNSYDIARARERAGKIEVAPYDASAESASALANAASAHGSQRAT